MHGTCPDKWHRIEVPDTSSGQYVVYCMLWLKNRLVLVGSLEATTVLVFLK